MHLFLRVRDSCKSSLAHFGQKKAPMPKPDTNAPATNAGVASKEHSPQARESSAGVQTDQPDDALAKAKAY